MKIAKDELNNLLHSKTYIDELEKEFEAEMNTYIEELRASGRLVGDTKENVEAIQTARDSKLIETYNMWCDLLIEHFGEEIKDRFVIRDNKHLYLNGFGIIPKLTIPGSKSERIIIDLIKDSLK